MRPLRLVLNVVGFVLAPAAIAGSITFVAIDALARRIQRTHPQLELDLADEAASWLALVVERAPTFPIEGDLA